ncbi:pyruvate kinase [bacterium]|nr:pyruvate kinase [bacterium]
MKFIPETKIISTLGPASSSEKIIREMAKAGMDVVRINFSHGDYEEYLGYIRKVRKINENYRRHIRIMGDLEGPRIRVGFFGRKKYINLEKNKTVYLVKSEEKATERQIPVDYKGDFSDFEGAEFIYMDDGNIVLKIIDLQKEKVKTKVVRGGILKQRKGINVPGAKLKFPVLNEKDKKDIRFAVENGFDFIALSFVRTGKDMEELEREVKSSEIKLVAKIENREGIKNIEGIIDKSDGVMIARGDMGISIPVYEVPFVQKEIIKKCKKKGKFSITATQMLESMVEHPFPTRAEVSDVANAVIDGTDYVMLSAETSIGKYPVEAVRMMNTIIKYTEIHLKSKS